MLTEKKDTSKGDLLNDFLFLGNDEEARDSAGDSGPREGSRNVSSSSDAIDAADLFDQYINKDMLMESIEDDSSPGLLKLDFVSPVKMENQLRTNVDLLKLDTDEIMDVNEHEDVDDQMNASGGVTDVHDDLTRENVEQWKLGDEKHSSNNTGVPMQNLTYYQQSERLLTHGMEFGRTRPFKTVYLNPTDFLPKDDDDISLPYKLNVDGIPSVSRVETQIKVNVSISPPPPQYMIHLPTDSITKQKLYLTHDITEYPIEVRRQMLFLETFLLCSSTNKTTYVCARCVKREQRRAARRKSGVSDNLLWCNNDNKRAIVFNSKQVLLMKEHECNENSKNFSLMTRIVCYCRHHKEPEGFKVLMVLRDADDNILARTVTNSIVIMDKKTTSKGKSSDNRTSDGYVKDEDSMTGQASDYSNSESYVSMKAEDSSAPVRLSIPKGMPSPTSITEDSSENVHTDHGPVNPTTPGFFHSSAAASARTNGYKRPRSSIDGTNKSERSLSNSSTSVTTALNVSSSISGPPHSLLQNKQPNLLSQMGSVKPAAAGIAAPVQQQQAAFPRPNVLVQQMGSSTTNTVPESGPKPFIQRVIPAQGPIKGGIEVTLLGSNFKPNMIVKFGDNRALSTQCWSESTIVTYLPPTSKPGQVLVSVFEREDHGNEQLLGNMSNSRAIFTYVDDTDRQLIELALQIVGLKMNGKLEDARNIAKRIVGSDGGSSNGSTPSSNISPSTNYNADSYATNSSNQVYYSDEMLILKVVKLLNPGSNLSMCNSDGQTMLHLACLKGYFHLVSALVKKGARVDVTDSFGFTPLHFACINGDVKAIQLLVECKANVTARADNGVDALDLYKSQHVSAAEKNNSYIEDALRLLATHDGGIEKNELEDELKMFGRKSSTSSFHSSVFDAESLDSVDYGFQVHVSKMVQDTLSDDSEYEFSGYDEMSELDDEVQDDTSLTIAQRESQLQLSTYVHPYRADGTGTTVKPSEELSQDNGEEQEGDRSARTPEGLPKYEDLFPVSGLNTSKNKVTELSLSIVREASVDTAPDSHDSQTSETSEDEEEALQVRLNRFFQQRQNFRNDKMLIFFWIPVMVILSSAFLAFQFGRDGNKIHHISETVSENLRTWMAKTLLGNDRMKAAFRESIHNLQNHRLLGEGNYLV